MNGAAVIIVQENRYMSACKKACAVSPDSARTLNELGIRENLAFRKLVGRGVLVLVNDNKYYMDEKAAKAFLKARRRFGLAVLFGLGVFILIIFLTGKM